VQERAEAEYQAIGEIRCPYFNETVAFNSRGLKHIKFKSERKARNRDDQYIRLKHIAFVPLILKQSHTLQEYKESHIFEETKHNKRRDNMLKKVKFYAFIAIVPDGNFSKRLKIIVREVEGGKKHFWSIVPYWKNNKQLKIHSGDPEID